VGELHLPTEKKTIKPISSSDEDPIGVYVYKDFLLKFARDTPQCLYGGEAVAMKAVGAEWRCLQELLSSNVFHLHQPLMTIVDYKGYRVAVFAQIPVSNNSEPLYGYSLSKRYCRIS